MGSYGRTHRISTIGPATVALLLLSGFANSWFMVGPANAISILRTDYGAGRLFASLILFAGMLVLATLNRFRVHAPAGPRRKFTGDSGRTAGSEPQRYGRDRSCDSGTRRRRRHGHSASSGELTVGRSGRNHRIPLTPRQLRRERAGVALRNSRGDRVPCR